MKDLETQRSELENQYKRKFEAHCTKYNKYVANEDEYRESSRQLRKMYQEWFDVAMELGAPIPVWL